MMMAMMMRTVRAGVAPLREIPRRVRSVGRVWSRPPEVCLVYGEMTIDVCCADVARVYSAKSREGREREMSGARMYVLRVSSVALDGAPCDVRV